MATIKLTHNDINEMVRRTIHSILSESVIEAQGSIMAEKEDIIQEVVDYVVERWEEIKSTNEEPAQATSFNFDDGNGVRFSGVKKAYIILIPGKITKKFETAERLDLNVAVLDYAIPQQYLKYLGVNERATNGTTYAGPEFNKFVRTTMKTAKARIDLMVPSINGELQLQGFYGTLYHEFNHAASRLELQKQHKNLTDDELAGLHFATTTRRKDAPAQNIIRSTMNQSSVENDPLALLRAIFGNDEEQKIEELKKEISFVFYSIWETTERNARAEAIYGELQALNATRENFKTTYPKTELYYQIKEIEDSLDNLEKIQVPSRLWSYAGKVMNMNRRGKNDKPSARALTRYQEAVKERFLSRSRELLNILYRKAMKVAELYFQRKENREKDNPGGGLDRLGQLLNTD